MKAGLRVLHSVERREWRWAECWEIRLAVMWDCSLAGTKEGRWAGQWVAWKVESKGGKMAVWKALCLAVLMANLKVAPKAEHWVAKWGMNWAGSRDWSSAVSWAVHLVDWRARHWAAYLAGHWAAKMAIHWAVTKGNLMAGKMALLRAATTVEAMAECLGHLKAAMWEVRWADLMGSQLAALKVANLVEKKASCLAAEWANLMAVWWEARKAVTWVRLRAGKSVA